MLRVGRACALNEQWRDDEQKWCVFQEHVLPCTVIYRSIKDVVVPEHIQKDFSILDKFSEEDLVKDFESSKDMDGRTGQWRDNLELWLTANHPPPPARIRSDYNIHDP